MSFLARKAFWREVLESGSSSTINTRTIFPSTRRLNWRPTFLSSLLSVDRSPATQESLSQRHRCLDRSRESPRPRKGASIVLAHSGDLAPSLLGLSSNAIANCYLQHPSRLPRRNFDPSSSAAASHAVENRIFDERLHDQLRHEQLPRSGVNLPTHFKSVFQTHFLHAEVVVDKLQFFIEANDIGARTLQSSTKQARDL